MKLYVGFFFFFLPQFLKTRLQHVSRVAPVLNTAVCKTSLMLQRPNLFTGAYPICKKKKKNGGGRGERSGGLCYIACGWILSNLSL